MVFPSAMQIESARAVLSKRTSHENDHAADEFRAACPGAWTAEVQAYLLGLETARVVLATNPTLLHYEIKPEELL